MAKSLVVPQVGTGRVLAHGSPGALAKDEVVGNRQHKLIAEGDQLASEVDVIRGGFKGARGMVVSEDDASAIAFESEAEDELGVSQGLVESPFGDDTAGLDVMSGVHHKDDKALRSFVKEVVAHDLSCIGRACDLLGDKSTEAHPTGGLLQSF